jgi:hypothetical protein
MYMKYEFLWSWYACIYVYKGKGKALPLQAWIGPWGSRRLRLQNLRIIGT